MRNGLKKTLVYGTVFEIDESSVPMKEDPTLLVSRRARYHLVKGGEKPIGGDLWR